MFRPDNSNEAVTYYYSADGSVHTVPIDESGAVPSGGTEDGDQTGGGDNEGIAPGSAVGSPAEDAAQDSKSSYDFPDREPQESPSDGTDSAGRHSGESGAGDAGSPLEEKRHKSVNVDGTGSDLFKSQTIDYYYEFTLEGESFRLPCKVSEVLTRGWELQRSLPAADQETGTGDIRDPDTGGRTGQDSDGNDPGGQKSTAARDSMNPAESAAKSLAESRTQSRAASGTDSRPESQTGNTAAENGAPKLSSDRITAGTPAPASDRMKTGTAAPSGANLIPAYSFEFFDAAPAAEDTHSTSFFSRGTPSRNIRLCIANFHSTPQEPSACTLCGISATLESGVSLQTAFGNGLGDSLDSLTNVFGTDRSIYGLTEYGDGIRTVSYRFLNGLSEGEQISVLAEAEEKSLSDLLLAETSEDGSTIRALSLYYFKVP